MAKSTQIVLAFDAYGTLLSTESISKQLAAHIGDEKAAALSQEWRKYQLEYTWRLNSMGSYLPFSTLTHQALTHALAEASLTLPPTAISSLMTSYNTLSLFPDVPPLFTHLTSSEHTHAVIFTNGTSEMLSATLSQSPEIAPHAHLFRDVVTVDAVQRFKPCPRVYRHLVERVDELELGGGNGNGREDGRGEGWRDIWLVSGNPFDVVGAKAAGLRACWVDRAGKGWVDRLGGGEYGPDVVVEGLDEVVERVHEAVKKMGAGK